MGMLAFGHDRGNISILWFFMGLVAAGACGVWILSWPQMLAGTFAALAIAYLRLPMPKPLLFLGTLSYSIYLVHVPLGGRIINIAKRYNLEGMTSQIVATLVALTVSMIGAYIWLRLFEKPAQRWSSAILYRGNVSEE